MAKQGKQYIELPYVVKGMDISLSGLLTFIEQAAPNLIKSGKAGAADLCFSLQVCMKHSTLHAFQEESNITLEILGRCASKAECWLKTAMFCAILNA